MPRNVTAGIEVRLAAAALLVITAVTPASASEVPHPDSLARLVARRYGSGDFHRVQALHYAFHVKFKGKDFAREWTWFPKQDSVVYRGKDTAGLQVSVAYSRRNTFSMESPGVKPVDKWFINDQYWLLFPLHLVWDKGLRLKAAPADARSGGKAGEAFKLTAAYPAEGGYTPGDAYDLFVDSAGTVKRWIFRKGDSPEPTREALWSAPENVGPLRLSLERPGPDKDFKLWFTGVRADTSRPSP